NSVCVFLRSTLPVFLSCATKFAHVKLTTCSGPTPPTLSGTIFGPMAESPGKPFTMVRFCAETLVNRRTDNVKESSTAFMIPPRRESTDSWRPVRPRAVAGEAGAEWLLDNEDLESAGDLRGALHQADLRFLGDPPEPLGVVLLQDAGVEDEDLLRFLPVCVEV